MLNIKKICKSLKNPSPTGPTDQQQSTETLIRVSDTVLDLLWSYEKLSNAEIEDRLSNLPPKRRTAPINDVSISEHVLSPKQSTAKSSSNRFTATPKKKIQLVKKYSPATSEKSYGSGRS
jgi:hypothetical protein